MLLSCSVLCKRLSGHPANKCTVTIRPIRSVWQLLKVSPVRRQHVAGPARHETNNFLTDHWTQSFLVSLWELFVILVSVLVLTVVDIQAKIVQSLSSRYAVVLGGFGPGYTELSMVEVVTHDGVCGDVIADIPPALARFLGDVSGLAEFVDNKVSSKYRTWETFNFVHFLLKYQISIIAVQFSYIHFFNLNCTHWWVIKKFELFFLIDDWGLTKVL